MPTLIAFDTSSDIASVSLMVRGQLVQTDHSRGVTTHSRAILPMIQSLLDKAGIRLGECDAIAFGCGPGSFTGVRTACGVAQGLAFGIDVPVIPVVSLLAMAEACRLEKQKTSVLSVLDARMREVYWAGYSYEEEGGWKTVVEPQVSPPSDVFSSGQTVACGNGLIAYHEAFASLVVDAQFPGIMPDSQAIASIAKMAFRRGDVLSPRDAHPLYLRNKVAYTTEERQNLKAGANHSC